MGSTFSTMIVLNRSRSSEWGRCADLSNQTSSLAGALSEIEIPLGYFAGNFPVIPSLHEEDRHSHLRHGGEQVNLEQLRPQDPHGAGTTPEEVEPVSQGILARDQQAADYQAERAVPAGMNLAAEPLRAGPS